MASSFENVNDCLICLTESVDVIEIIEKTAGKQDNIGTIISKYFWFEATDYENRKLCTTCWKKIYDFHTFYLEIESLHERDVWQTHQPIVEINMGEIVEPSTVKTEEIKDEFDFDMTHVNIKTECSDELEDKQVNKADKANESEQSDESDSETSEEEQEEEDSVDSDDSDQPLIKRKKSSPKKTTKKSTKKEKEDDLIRKVCPLECDKCKKKFKTFQSLYSHYEKEHDCKGYAMCCTKKFCKKNELLDHVERHENPSKFKCQQCSKVLVSSKSLQSHIKAMHNDEKPYKCEECPKSFIRKSLLDRHKGVHVPVDKREFTCEYCAKKHKNINQLGDHMRMSHMDLVKVNKRYKCDKCIDKSYLRIKRLLEHKEAHHSKLAEEKKTYVCDICDKRYAKSVSLKYHQEVAHGSLERSLRYEEEKRKIKADDETLKASGKLNCNECRQTDFDYFKDLKRHYKEVHKRAGYVFCCDKRIFKKSYVIRHLLLHENPNLFQCTICLKNFGEVSALKLHTIHMHSAEKDRVYKCDQCPLSFPRIQQLRMHMGYHVPVSEYTFRCEPCNKSFPTSIFLSRHKVNHHSQPRICELCAKSFNNPSSFTKHMKLVHDKDHEKVRLNCEFCEKDFANAPLLKRHMITHTNPHSHQCDLCEHRSHTKQALKSHRQRVHFTGKDFSCTLCDRAYKSKIRLREHIATHTGEILYNCEFCTRTFISHSNFAVHRKQMHPVEWLEDKKLKNAGKKPRTHIKTM